MTTLMPHQSPAQRAARPVTRRSEVETALSKTPDSFASMTGPENSTLCSVPSLVQHCHSAPALSQSWAGLHTHKLCKRLLLQPFLSQVMLECDNS